MRTGLWMAAIILLVVIVGGVLGEQVIADISDRYVSVGQELEVLCLEGDWQQAETVLTEAWQAWYTELPWLCALVNHADAELMTAALTEIRAAIRVQDHSQAVSGCYALMASAGALRDHERLTFENVL